MRRIWNAKPYEHCASPKINKELEVSKEEDIIYMSRMAHPIWINLGLGSGEIMVRICERSFGRNSTKRDFMCGRVGNIVWDNYVIGVRIRYVFQLTLRTNWLLKHNYIVSPRSEIVFCIWNFVMGCYGESFRIVKWSF